MYVCEFIQGCSLLPQHNVYGCPCVGLFTLVNLSRKHFFNMQMQINTAQVCLEMRMLPQDLNTCFCKTELNSTLHGMM